MLNTAYRPVFESNVMIIRNNQKLDVGQVSSIKVYQSFKTNTKTVSRRWKEQCRSSPTCCCTPPPAG